MKKYIKYFFLLFWVFGGLLYWQAISNAGFADWYAVTIYTPVAKSISTVIGFIPFSLAEFIIIADVIAVIAYLVYYIVNIIKKKDQRKTYVLNFFVNIVIICGMLFFLFATNEGINYYRSGFAADSGLIVEEHSTAQLTELCNILAETANLQSEQVDRDENGVATYSQGETADNYKQYCKEAYDTMEETYPTLQSGFGECKSLLLSNIVSYTNTTGFMFPYTFEANVNTDIPAYTIPFTMCHEMSHVRGYMKEDEANFLGYLVCENSSDAMTQYSGTFQALIYATNALYAQDTETYAQVYSLLNENVTADLQANNEYWNKYKGAVADVSQSVNDGYLKSFSQNDGVQSYGEMVDLLLAYYSEYI